MYVCGVKICAFDPEKTGDKLLTKVRDSLWILSSKNTYRPPKYIGADWHHVYVLLHARYRFYEMNHISLHGTNNFKKESSFSCSKPPSICWLNEPSKPNPQPLFFIFFYFLFLKAILIIYSSTSLSKCFYRVTYF